MKEWFINLARKLNIDWKGGFTESEINENANVYFDDCELSKENGTPLGSIKVLLNLLLTEVEEGNTEYANYIDTICNYICEY